MGEMIVFFVEFVLSIKAFLFWFVVFLLFFLFFFAGGARYGGGGVPYISWLLVIVERRGIRMGRSRSGAERKEEKSLC